MRWFFPGLRSIRRPARLAPKRNRSWILEDLEGRRLLSATLQPIVSLPAGAGITNMIAGPDGNLWVGVNETGDSAEIDRIGLDGTVTSFPVPENGPAGVFLLWSIATGPNGDIWFDGQIGLNPIDTQVFIGNITPAGVITEFAPIPVLAGLTAGTLGPLASGPGGDLSFDYLDTTPTLTLFFPKHQSFVGEVTTAGAVSLRPVSSFGKKSPIVSSLAVGADGNLWFVKDSARKSLLERMTPGGAITSFRIPGRTIVASVGNGPNGTLIVTAISRKFKKEVFSVSTSGAFTRFNIPTKVTGAFGAYLGSADGSLWFWFENFPSGPLRLGQISADGSATGQVLAPAVHRQQSSLESLVSGQDGNLYTLLNTFGPGANNTTTVDRLSTS